MSNDINVDSIDTEHESTIEVNTVKKGRSSKVGDSTPTLKVGIHRINDSVDVIPSFATDGSACFDLIANLKNGDEIKCNTSTSVTSRKVNDKGIAIHPGDRFLIPTGLIFDIPEGHCLKVYTRSGISFKEGITLTNCTGVIDSDYINELFVSVVNIGSTSKYIKHGDRIAQAKLERLIDYKIEEIKSPPAQKTKRNGGFGSTGTGS